MLTEREYRSKIESIADDFIQNGGRFVDPKTLLQTGGAALPFKDQAGWSSAYATGASASDDLVEWIFGDKIHHFTVTDAGVTGVNDSSSSTPSTGKPGSFYDKNHILNPEYFTLAGLQKLGEIYKQLIATAPKAMDATTYPLTKLLFNTKIPNIHREHRYVGSKSSFMSGGSGGRSYSTKYKYDAPRSVYTLEKRIMKGGGSDAEFMEKTIEDTIKRIDMEVKRTMQRLENKHYAFVQAYKDKGGSGEARLEQALLDARTAYEKGLRKLMYAEMWARFVSTISSGDLKLQATFEDLINTPAFKTVMNKIKGKDDKGIFNVDFDTGNGFETYLKGLRDKVAAQFHWVNGLNVYALMGF